ncbi:hypothetical protein [Delftia acidovorans]|uniref:hypothetical protein n=1 Tax=Delftia acidovorans TaxID=80866 RepID=UPI003D0CC07C
MTEAPMKLDLRNATQRQLCAIQNVADRHGLTFDEAVLKILLDQADKAEKEPPKGVFARLRSFFSGC